jgi:hypothetical protein
MSDLAKRSSSSQKKKGVTMVAFVKVSKKGKLVRIKEVPDIYRDKPYEWDEDE